MLLSILICFIILETTAFLHCSSILLSLYMYFLLCLDCNFWFNFLLTRGKVAIGTPVTYTKGTEVVLADTLSRANKVPQPVETAAEATRGETEKDVESINMTQYIPMFEETQTRTQRATEEDAALRDLKTVIRHGWPLRKEDVPVKVRDYFPFRDELTVQNGLIFKGERLAVPTSSREEMTKKLHSSHIGIQG